ncbi:MAG: hypothetical protein WCF84_10345 [Anaerolineae bacterium]
MNLSNRLAAVERITREKGKPRQKPPFDLIVVTLADETKDGESNPQVADDPDRETLDRLLAEQEAMGQAMTSAFGIRTIEVERIDGAWRLCRPDAIATEVSTATVQETN